MTETEDDPGAASTSSNGSAAREGEGDGAGEAAASTPEERIAALQADRDEIKDRMLRIAAEFENWKKRARKEQSDGEARVREAVLKDVLEIADSLERATTAFPSGGDGAVDGAAILKGVNL